LLRNYAASKEEMGDEEEKNRSGKRRTTECEKYSMREKKNRKKEGEEYKFGHA
jgi:hypothetical protein